MSIFDFAIKFFFRHSQPERLTGGASDVIESRVADPISRNLDIIKERLPEYRQVADETETVLANVKKLVGDDSFGRYGYINHPALTPEARRELIEHRNRAISYSDRMATSIYPYKSAAENLKWHGYSSADLDVEIAATGELVHDTFERLYTVAHQLGGPPGLWYNGGVLGREVYDRCAPGMEAAFDDPHVAPL